MSDSIQRVSSVPLPEHVTQRVDRNPLPVSSSQAREAADEKRLEPARQETRDGFETYLENQAILHLEQVQASTRFDPVEELRKASVYQDPTTRPPV
ncbi:hypothetical protein [Prosthecomicrobium sp. N25]|uniref:hypothetical protein n=1 Tax=Prosthecomicrobium sp. N25 TaxID=3129254 RepID=UPI0030773145